MAKTPAPLDWDAIGDEIAENARKSWDNLDHEALKRKSEAERQRAIRNGWIDEEGNSLLPPEPEDDDEDEEV
jgi:hypothetical protein